MHQNNLLAEAVLNNGWIHLYLEEQVDIPYQPAPHLQSSLQERIYHPKAFCMDQKRESSLA